MSDPIKYVIVSLKTDVSYLPGFDIPEFAAIPVTSQDLEVLLSKQNTISHLNLRYGAIDWDAVLFCNGSDLEDFERVELLKQVEKAGYVYTFLDFSENALTKGGATLVEAWETCLQVHHTYGPVYLYAELDDDASTQVLFNAFHLEEITF